MQFRDQISHVIFLPFLPKRIISLVPSQTQLLCFLGLKEELVGITKFCIHPQSQVKFIKKIGGTKNIDIEKINALAPDLIIANKEENTQESIEALQQKYPVWTSDVNSLEDALQMIQAIGKLVGKIAEARELVRKIQLNFKQLSSKALIPKKIAYFIWQNPYMVAANNTFINAMLGKCGLQNIFKTLNRYPIIELKELHDLNPDYILLSSEPYPFQKKHFKIFQEAYPKAKIIIVDGEMFSWYGSNLLLAPTYFKQLLADIR